MTDSAHAVNLLLGVALFAFMQSHAVASYNAAEERIPHAAVSHQSQTIYHQPRGGTPNSRFNYPSYADAAATPNLWSLRTTMGSSAYDYVRQQQQQALQIPTDANLPPPLFMEQYNNRHNHDYVYYNGNPQRNFPAPLLPPYQYHREQQHRIGNILTRNEAAPLLPSYSLSGNAYGSPEESRIQADAYSAQFVPHFQRYLQKYPRRLQPQYVSAFHEK